MSVLVGDQILLRFIASLGGHEHVTDHRLCCKRAMLLVVQKNLLATLVILAPEVTAGVLAGSVTRDGRLGVGLLTTVRA